ncbi:EAL domain-containing protein [Pseudomaricurvus alkylphenolicus]|uniref:putative bifunctional diguanylate cyclase/phosphodiesterase n=1 Tax=Pseudomaricurvus alkylphenolicus TaxID=1306991 RepID=UPI001421529B|nr:EAL domain-containing protein [Pseudomaricurvus alkylphenolicus]NIB39115.1 EAL domain-containing protein [Pseudomaricurvus alkylphenolicus]
MSIEFFKRLAFKLMRSSLTLVLVLGVLVALLQVYMDFRHQKTAIETNVNEIFRVMHNAAGRAVHLLDNRLADEVIRGLEYYDFLHSATIFDDADNVMAELNVEQQPSNTYWLTSILTQPRREFSKSLIYSDGTYEGKITLVVNQDRALSHFYERAITIFVSGIARNFSLALVLMLLYHYVLTKPLVKIAHRFSHINPSRTRGARIEHIAGHENDELGFIVNSANEFIEELETQRLGLEQSEQQLRIILDSSPNHIFALDAEGRFVFVNAVLLQFYGIESQDMIGQTFADVHADISPSETDKVWSDIIMAERLRERRLNHEQPLTNIHGETRRLEISYVPFEFFEQPCVLVIGSDITDRVVAEERVENLAYFDTLTGLPNRNMLYDHLNMDISRSQRNNTFGALFFIDLDDFKRINDTMGHSTGDEVLLQVARVMQAQIRQTDTLARLGGDEFTLSLPDLSGDVDIAQSQAADFAERLLTKISQPIRVDNQEFIVGASIGIVIYPDCADDTEALLRFADTAMYQAKKSGRNCYRLFEVSMAAEVDRAVKLENELRIAVKEQQFTFFLQPIVDSATGNLVCAEALMRWQHPERGMVPPVQFIDFLENSGNIHGVDQFILGQVCSYISHQRHLGQLPEGFRIAVNISAKELHRRDFVEQVEAILALHDVPGSCIELEITEGAALRRLDEVVHKMRLLQARGITFALDDFGTGYSSLSYLKRLPVDKIKIDKSFIKDLTIDPQDEALVASVIAIAKTMGLRVVAEGVETSEQAEWLKRHGDLWYQGYLFDRPLPKSEFQDQYLVQEQLQEACQD